MGPAMEIQQHARRPRESHGEIPLPMWPPGIRSRLGAALVAALLPMSAPAAPVTAGAGSGAGSADPGAALVQKFAAALSGDFAPGDAPDEARCGTALVRAYLAQRPSLAADAVSAIDGFLAYADAQDTLLSPGGHFRLGWMRDGDNAVPLADVAPQDGIPDFVARIAGYLDRAWSVAVEDVGLRAPPGGPMDVSFRRMYYYGYAVPVDPVAGSTRLVLHNSFARFPPNDDPEGDAIGSAKVTAAHEFRHCSQYAGSRWSEGGWVELDATWAEERTCAEVNDYHHYLLGDSPVRRPQVPLDAGVSGTGSYDDAVLGIWLNRTWGDALMRDYWERRARATEEDPLESWDAVLAPRGSSLAAAWGAFTGWNYASGERASEGLGYPDAADFPTGNLAAAAWSYPALLAGDVAHLAAAPIGLSGLEHLGGALLRVRFDGDDEGGPLSLAVHLREVDGGASLESVGLDRDNDAEFVIRTPADRLAGVGLVVGNPARDGSARPWTAEIDTIAGPPPPLRGRLVSVEPNPSNGGARLGCEMSAGAHAMVEVLDARGRRVRSLFTGHLGPGRHEFHWDGRADDGRHVAAGAYLAVVTANGREHARKLTLVR